MADSGGGQIDPQEFLSITTWRWSFEAMKDFVSRCFREQRDSEVALTAISADQDRWLEPLVGENPTGNTTVVKYHSTTIVSSTGSILSRLLGDAGPVGRLHYGGLWARRERRVVTLEIVTGMKLVHESKHLSTRQRRRPRQQQSVALGPSL